MLTFYSDRNWLADARHWNVHTADYQNLGSTANESQHLGDEKETCPK